MKKPIWCKCRKQLWQRTHLKAAVENNRTLRCPVPECQRELAPELIEELLLKLKEIEYELPEGYEEADDPEDVEEIEV